MDRKIAAALAGALAFVCVASASAEEIYRCGDTYSQKPCPGGQRVEAADARSAAQARDATQAAKRDAKTADAMEKARLKEEARPPSMVVLSGKAVGQHADAPQAPASAKSKMSKPKKPEGFTAVEPKKAGEEPAGKKKKS